MVGRVAAVVVAAGRGQRVGGDVPKQYRSIAGEPVIRPALAAFLTHPQIHAVQPVIHAQDAEAFRAATTGLQGLSPVWGGATRQASVRAGLEALRAVGPDFVLIHDAARPFLTRCAYHPRDRRRGREHRAAVPAVAVADTVKQVDERETVIETLDRSRLRLVQTPQAFAFDLIIEAQRPRRGRPAAKTLPTTPRLPNGPAIASRFSLARATNVKLTTNDDFIRAEAIRYGGACRRTHRKRLRCARLRRRRSCHARRRPHPHMRAASPDIPTPTSFFTLWSMLFLAPSPMAILDRTFPRATRNGVEHRPIDFSSSPASACAHVRA